MTEPGDVGARSDPAPAGLAVRALTALTATLMFSMMAITFIDVIGRYVFNSPVGATFEIIEIMLGLLIFSALPLVARNQGHITVSLFEGLFRGRAGRIQQIFVLLFSTAAVAFMSYRMWAEMLTMRADQDVGEFLDMELWPFIGAVCALSAVTFVILVGLTIDFFRTKADRPAAASPGDPL